MKILFYGINYAPELTGIGKYTGEMAAWYAEAGHEVQVITAPPYYPEWKVAQGYSASRYDAREESGVRVTRCPLYVPGKPSALKRILHLASFSLSSAFPLLAKIRWKPQLIVLVVPTLFCALQALLVSRLTGAQIVLHIQDFEVDAMFGLIAKPGKLSRLAYWIERQLMNRFDWVSTISPGMIRRARSKGVEETKLMLFPNWSEVSRFTDSQRDDAYLTQLGLTPSKKTVLYSGNLGEKQGLESVLEAAQALKERDDLQFLIVGDGAAKERLQILAQSLGLKNLTFAPLQPYEDLPRLLASADCHLVVQRRGAADAVLPSKLTNILAVGGNAVITADKDTSLGVLCEEYPGVAVLVAPESTAALIQGITACVELPQPNTTAAQYAKTYLDKETILRHFIGAFDSEASASSNAVKESQPIER